MLYRNPMPLAALTFGALLAGCASKPKPTAAREPDAPAMAASAPSDAAGPGNADTRRDRMLARAREVFQTVYFPYDQAVLDGKAKETLARIRDFLAEFPEVSVSIAGHADERGTEEYNLALGAQRANTVSEYLAALGVSKSNLKAMSYGEERPAKEGHSEEDWRANRRAEFAPEL